MDAPVIPSPSLPVAIATAPSPTGRRRRLQPAHSVAASVLSLGLIAFGGHQKASGLEAKLEDQAKAYAEQTRRLETETGKVEDLRLFLTEIKTQLAARDQAIERLSVSVAELVKELRELERDRARDAEQLREHDRRLGALEQGRK